MERNTVDVDAAVRALHCAESLIGALESLRDFNLGGLFVAMGPQKRRGSKFVDLTILAAEGRVHRRGYAAPQARQ